MTAISQRASWPQLGDSSRIVTERLGRPISHSLVHSQPVRQYIVANRTLTLLYEGIQVVAVHCTYRATRPTWSDMQDECRRFLPHHPTERDTPLTPPIMLRTERGWVLALAHVPLGTVQALVAR